jgi:putative membrane protein
VRTHSRKRSVVLGVLAGASIALAPLAAAAQSGSGAATGAGSSATQAEHDHPGAAQGAPAAEAGAGTRAAGEVSKIDEKKFVTEAAAGSRAEVELAKIAERRARNPAVKEFAQRMQRDHSATNERLEKLAQGLGIQLPDRLDPEHQQLADRLEKLEADDFDADYMKAMVDDHEKDVAEFRQASLTKEGAVASFAEQTLPTLEKHLEMARQINQQVAASGPAGTKYENEPDAD